MVPDLDYLSGWTAELGADTLRAFPAHQFMRLATGDGFDMQISMNVLQALGDLPRTATTDRHLIALTTVYRTALRLGLPPRPTIAAYWDRPVDSNSVDRWISAARTGGYLGEAPAEKHDHANRPAARHHRGQCPAQKRRQQLRDEVDSLTPHGDMSAGTREWRPKRRATARAGAAHAAWPVIGRDQVVATLTAGEEPRRRAAATGRAAVVQFIVEYPEKQQAVARRLTYSPDGTLIAQTAVIEWPRLPQA
ncbi:hypothetical protein [Kitasatospora purpeofusca]|uniref:hypothetical protein n=1 Tax=Kitasatospora purpeofusca TaxID=67352 RepID=UPI0036C91549